MAAATNSDKFSKLPELAKPFLYEVNLSLCMKSFKFRGNEKIHLEISKSTDFLKLHSAALEVAKASLKLEDGTALSDLGREMDNKWTLLTVRLPNAIKPQKAELEFEFSGELSSDMLGFYRSSYKDMDGNEQFLASTQFESTYARRAFPCWDEPLYKAQFDIQLEVEDGLTVLSNMNAVEEHKSGEDSARKVVKFARTPLMSTYLVAFAVGKLEFIQAKSKIGCDMRVYTVPGKSHQADYALEVASKCIDWYSDWFGIRMPLPKCDLLAVPDFSMGAMENWGLITYREQYLLVDPTKTSSSQRQSITSIIAHECAHFWFGNLVTMKWWTDLWLKEGFASFMDYVFTDVHYPEFRVWLSFVNSEINGGMELDSMRSSHPIEVPIENPNELDEIYDSITYAKSNSVIRMLYNHLGPDVFKKGLRIYLQKHQYANAVTEDLWNSLSEASGINVSELMGTWTKQMGFPLVSVDSRQLDGKRELRLQQRRFLADGGEDDSNPLWRVPIGISTRGTKLRAKHLMVKPEESIVVDGLAEQDWLKLNPDFTSFIHVQYSDQMLKQLFEAIKLGEMDVLDRFQLGIDLFALVSATKVPASKFLEFINVCRGEQDYFVWLSIDSGLGSINHVLGHLEDGGLLQKRFHQFVCQIVEPVAAKLGWTPQEGEDMHTGRLRALLLNRLTRSQHASTMQTAQAKFDEHVEAGVDLVPDLRRIIYATVGRTKSAKNVAALQKILETINFSEVERNCITALGQCSDPDLLGKVYKYGVVDGNIRGQDLFYLFAGTSSAGPIAQRVGWEAFRDNVDLLLEKYGGSVNAGLFQDGLKLATESFCSSAMAEEIQDFCKNHFDEHSLKTLDRPIRQIVESIKLHERLLESNKTELDEYLSKAGF